jgi:plasmid stabilization system protein ParE
VAYRVVSQDSAERDIVEAYSYIAEDAPDAALRWYRRIKESIRSLSDMPNRCARAPESDKLGIEIRQLIFGRRTGVYRIVFRIDESRQEVHILTVRHGATEAIQARDIE